MAIVFSVVMPGHPGPAAGRPECKLVPGIHVFKLRDKIRRGWPDKPGHDEIGTDRLG